MGLSPHARGNPKATPRPLLGKGPIPACAGEPALCFLRLPHYGAYPRMRGGTFRFSVPHHHGTGLSPHARGNRSVVSHMARGVGPIPACAGVPWRCRCRALVARAYPRMRGGTGGVVSSRLITSGLSPHARGNQRGQKCGGARQGPIPACAGEPVLHQLKLNAVGAYPRMRGGTPPAALPTQQRVGLSPHARGNRGAHIDDFAIEGPIPACAGEPFSECSLKGLTTAYPRRRGGTFGGVSWGGPRGGLSPHARGNLCDAGACQAATGPIPACAGEPCPACSPCAASRAYPRMRGGTNTMTVAMVAVRGLSPHARGNPCRSWRGFGRCGPIPACAGEPHSA